MCGKAEVMAEFHRAHNRDPDSVTGPWVPASFEEAPDHTKQRTVKFTSQLNVPGWLKKLMGAGQHITNLFPITHAINMQVHQYPPPQSHTRAALSILLCCKPIVFCVTHFRALQMLTTLQATSWVTSGSCNKIKLIYQSPWFVESLKQH